jgi:hypothetical protein
MSNLNCDLSLNREISLALAESIGALPRQCWRNAALALVSLGRGMYVEGVAVTLGLPMEHGWVEVDGQIVDPTWTSVPSAVYYPVFSYTLDEVMLSTGQTMPFYVHEDKKKRTLMVVLEELLSQGQHDEVFL